MPQTEPCPSSELSAGHETPFIRRFVAMASLAGAACRPALLDERGGMTYAELAARVDRIASFLLREGLKRGRRPVNC